MSPQEKTLNALQELSRQAGHDLKIIIDRPYDTWVVYIVAGDAKLVTTLDTFLRAPKIIFEPFGEEIIRKIK